MDHSMQNFPVLDLSEIASRETDEIRSIDLGKTLFKTKLTFSQYFDSQRIRWIGSLFDQRNALETTHIRLE